MSDQTLPSYDELPVTPGAPPGSSWGLWGDGDVFGCLNLLTPERAARAAATVTAGEAFPLNLEIDVPNPPLFNRAAPTHHVTGKVGETGHDDILSDWNTQASSQWDGFRHVRGHPGYYNGVDDEAHGIHHWARRGIVGRGVLADVARWRELQGRPIDGGATDAVEIDDLTGTLAAQETELETGDILLIRTGWVQWYRSLDERARRDLAGNLRAPGLRPGEATARWLWNAHVAAVAADNPALEAWPPGSLATPEQQRAASDDPSRRFELFVHLSLLPLLGIPIGELWDLDRLAEGCARHGRYHFLLVSAPLNVPAGVASPPNAVAIL